MKVLHITSWYPNKSNPIEGIFIKEHFMSLSKHCDNYLLHLNIIDDSECFLKVNSSELSENESSIIITTKMTKWLFKEGFILIALLYFLKKNRKRIHYDLINFHIAYPLCAYLPIVKTFIKKPIVITEHWSAYHYNFGMQEGSKKLDKIKKIFRKLTKVITVSDALADDIKRFSGNRSLNFSVVPNVVNTSIFYLKSKRSNKKEMTLLAVNVWRKEKQPILLLQVFRELLKKKPHTKLRIGGKGPEWDEIHEYIKTYNLVDNVILLGWLKKDEISEEIQNASALIQCTNYETFSVICAESICCGTPVIASRVGGIPEFINSSNGILVENNTLEYWLQSILFFVENVENFNQEEISKSAIQKFSKESVGEKYYKVLQDVYINFKLKEI